ncbi:MAG TPA: DUF3243 domain-containing protein [Bacillota bacterium]|nr:DUF3243 domain-containing protein [Bacillota bacterium]
MSMLDNFNTWKEFLANRLQDAESSGIDQQTIQTLAHEVGDYLAENVSAKNPEEEVLKELWNAASEEEQQAIANSMVKLIKKSN